MSNNEAPLSSQEEKINELNKFITSIENDLMYIPEDADLGQVIFDTRKKINKFMVAEYSPSPQSQGMTAPAK